jgi:cytoskeletal protein CcmA (bactofilin family)
MLGHDKTSNEPAVTPSLKPAAAGSADADTATPNPTTTGSVAGGGADSAKPGAPTRAPAPRGAPRGAFPFDMPRRGAADPAAAQPARQERPEPPASREKSMHVGAGVRFKGEVSACDRLVIEGDAEATISDCRLVQIGVNGRLSGTIDTAEVDISGTFDGDLVARERLTVRGKGRLRGRARYRHIVVEAGGVVTGEISALEDEDARGRAGPTRPAKGATPVSGD